MRTGQLQTQETILVLFIVVIIILLGMALFVKHETTTLALDRTTYERTRLATRSLALGSDALLACSHTTAKEPCVNTLNILAAAPILKKDPSLGYANITFTQLYPITPASRCTTDHLTDCGTWQLYLNKPATITSTTKTITPISLYRPEENTYTLGLLTAETYNL